MIKIKNIKIEGIGPIKDLELEFDSHFNIICGQNGIGKTTILDCLAQSFAGSQTTLKKTAGFEKGQWDINVTINGNVSSKSFLTNQFHPNETSRNYNGYYQNSNDVIVFKTHRNIEYIKLDSLGTDQIKDHNNFSYETISGSVSNELKNWFVNRFLFSAQPN